MFVQLEEFGCMCTILSRVKIIESVGFLIQKHETDESTKYVLFVLKFKFDSSASPRNF